MSTQKKDSDWVDEEPTKDSKPKSKAKIRLKPTKKGVVHKVTVKRVKSKALKAKTVDENKKITVNFKVLPKEYRSIRFKAKTLTNGNVTQMVRLAVAAWKPAKPLEGIRRTTRAV